MQLYPSVTTDAEVAYRRERIAEQFRGSGARMRRAPRRLADRLRWAHRRGRAAARRAPWRLADRLRWAHRRGRAAA